MNPIDPSRLKLRRNGTPVSTPTQRPLHIAAKGQRFLRGPIPLPWLSSAARLPGKALHVGLAIWLEAGFRNTAVVPLSNVAGQHFGLDRNAKYRGLRSLEQAGLIMAERRPGRSPIITIVMDSKSAKGSSVGYGR